MKTLKPEIYSCFSKGCSRLNTSYIILRLGLGWPNHFPLLEETHSHAFARAPIVRKIWHTRGTKTSLVIHEETILTVLYCTCNMCGAITAMQCILCCDGTPRSWRTIIMYDPAIIDPPVDGLSWNASWVRVSCLNWAISGCGCGSRPGTSDHSLFNSFHSTHRASRSAVVDSSLLPLTLHAWFRRIA